MNRSARIELPAWQQEVLRLMRARAWRQALESLEGAAAPGPRTPAQGVLTAQCLIGLGRHREAREVAEPLLRDAPADLSALDALGCVFSQIGDQPLALDAFNRALELSPGNPHFLFNRATVYRFLGRFADAEADYDRVIAQRPTDYEAYLNRSELRRQTAERNHRAALEAILQRRVPDPLGEVRLRYALAKEYEDLGDYPSSFREVSRAAAQRRLQLRYDPEVDVATVNWIIEAFPAVPAADRARPSEAGPVFIVGLPRSGSTLVERILGCHSEINCGGELKAFALCLTEAIQAVPGCRPPSRRDFIQRSRELDFAALGAAYVDRVRHMLFDERRFTDKMPLNFLYCGLIRRALPNAKIVHVMRHPMAACYAMYKTLFNEGYPFSYDLTELAGYYIAYRRLMAHWDALMPGEILTLKYEALIASPEREIRRLLDFCGLPWQASCLDFHLHSAPSTTASAVQVRQPLYASSIDLWRRFEEPLAGLRARLQAGHIDMETE